MMSYRFFALPLVALITLSHSALSAISLCPDPVSIDPPTVPPAHVSPGKSYGPVAISATPGSIYTFAITQGVLPNGLLLSGAADDQVDVSGTATTGGEFVYTLTATDVATGCSGGRVFGTTVFVCGDHSIDATVGEECDDGNNTDGDGCDASCIIENVGPSATNLSVAENYTEDTPLILTPIVISDVDSANVTTTLTMSDTTAGSLSTGTSESVTSTYTAGTGLWIASGALADVNTLLSSVTYTPTPSYTSSFTIATSVDDGVAPAITGVKPIAVIIDPADFTGSSVTLETPEEKAAAYVYLGSSDSQVSGTTVKIEARFPAFSAPVDIIIAVVVPPDYKLYYVDSGNNFVPDEVGGSGTYYAAGQTETINATILEEIPGISSIPTWDYSGVWSVGYIMVLTSDPTISETVIYSYEVVKP